MRRRAMRSAFPASSDSNATIGDSNPNRVTSNRGNRGTRGSSSQSAAFDTLHQMWRLGKFGHVYRPAGQPLHTPYRGRPSLLPRPTRLRRNVPHADRGHSRTHRTSISGFTLGLDTVDAARRRHDVEAAPGSPSIALVVWTDDLDKEYADLTTSGWRSIRSIVDPAWSVGDDAIVCLIQTRYGYLNAN